VKCFYVLVHSIPRFWISNAARVESLSLKRKLLRFYADVGELSKAPIERGRRRVLGLSHRGDQTVHEMHLRFSIAVQRVQVNRRAADFNTRAGNESAKR
jgi:hypothetical protein